ncbi:MAG: hypothetical protein ABR499_03260 [Gemmatimonadaceae bacterium]
MPARVGRRRASRDSRLGERADCRKCELQHCPQQPEGSAASTDPEHVGTLLGGPFGGNQLDIGRGTAAALD